MRIGIEVDEALGPVSLDEMVGRVRAAAEAGFATAWWAQLFNWDALTTLGPLLQGESVSYQGETLRAVGEIHVPGAEPPSLLLAALGPVMLRIAGELGAARLPSRVSGAEASGGAGLRPGDLGLPILRRRTRFEREQEPPRDPRDVVDGRIEGGLVRLRGLVEAADLPHELQRGVMDLVLGDWRLEVEQRPDVPAHANSPTVARAPHRGARATVSW